ncbi:MAG TPA: host attachment protein [Kofleriaceae bacterium]|nr:host attachment protein [Kofleriaceae bacterium]
MTKHGFEPLDLLRRLGDQYRHVEQEHRRQPSSRSATRHRLADQMRDLEAHFDRLLVEWVPEHSLRARWREFLHGHAPSPDEPHLARPPLFKGRTDAGTTIEIRPASDGYDIFADGARTDHSGVPWHLDPDMRGAVQIGEHACEELFDAPPEAIDALVEFLAGRAEPPWRWARALVEDGLIDPDLALTPRGRRCLDRARAASVPSARARNFCVLVADAARARMLVLDIDHASGQMISELIEVGEITNPMLRARDSEVVSDSGGGRRGGAKTPIHATSDHRDQRRRDIERHFAGLVAEEAAEVWRRYPSCELVIVASPVMLGMLRPAIDRQIRPKDRIERHELARDLTKLSAPMLHDLLAESGLLPARGRRAPILRTPGQPA